MHTENLQSIDYHIIYAGLALLLNDKFSCSIYGREMIEKLHRDVHNEQLIDNANDEN